MKIHLIASLFALMTFLASPKAHAVEWVIDENFSINYTFGAETFQLEFVLKNGQRGWMAVAFHDFPFPADTIIASYDYENQVAYCIDGYNPGIPTLPNYPSPLQDTNSLILIPGDPSSNQDNVSVASSSVEGGVTTIVCERNMTTDDILDFQFEIGMYISVFASYSSAGGFIVTPQPTQQPSPSARANSGWLINTFN